MNSQRPTGSARTRLKTRSARLIVAGDSIVCADPLGVPEALEELDEEGREGALLRRLR